MSAYDEMTNADVLSGEEMHEYEQAVEAQLDALDDERWAAEAARVDERDEELFEDLADGEER
ncbi:hypothetical protein [Streptomyces rubiginosohelvolus]|uniref:hypothetical protein n=1 Tax=Streptomyces rubiginosohelvolus TaxID=67362 RepID=UPI0036612AD7